MRRASRCRPITAAAAAPNRISIGGAGTSVGGPGGEPSPPVEVVVEPDEPVEPDDVEVELELLVTTTLNWTRRWNWTTRWRNSCWSKHRRNWTRSSSR
ncbi:hypothetical protein [Novosphingobium sp. ST904]|uniref:hypothetical protein n=1 Tax=Novosphingobium sp. ST904 TaxID=1684385 RepID=UPI001E2B5E7B|nr:hypothetical protein [Novosphingobium sp. ST904]